MLKKTILFFALLATATTASARRRAVSPDSCSVTVSQQALTVPAAGGQLAIAVTVSGGCAWVPTSADTWLSASPSGSTLIIVVQPNTSTTPRTAVIHIRGAIVVINQAGAQGQPNLVSNGNFDSTIAGWSNVFSTGTGSAVWAAPGVALITSTQAGRGYQLHQCVNLQPNRRYEMGVKALIAQGEADGYAVFGVYEYRIPNCDTTLANPETRREEVRPTPRGEWFEMTKSFFTVTNAQSLLIVIGAGGSSAPTFSARFDEVYVRERP